MNLSELGKLEELVIREAEKIEDFAEGEKGEWQRGYYQGFADGLFQIRKWLQRIKDIWEKENGQKPSQNVS